MQYMAWRHKSLLVSNRKNNIFIIFTMWKKNSACEDITFIQRIKSIISRVKMYQIEDIQWFDVEYGIYFASVTGILVISWVTMF